MLPMLTLIPLTTFRRHGADRPRGAGYAGGEGKHSSLLRCGKEDSSEEPGSRGGCHWNCGERIRPARWLDHLGWGLEQGRGGTMSEPLRGRQQHRRSVEAEVGKKLEMVEKNQGPKTQSTKAGGNM